MAPGVKSRLEHRFCLILPASRQWESWWEQSWTGHCFINIWWIDHSHPAFHSIEKQILRTVFGWRRAGKVLDCEAQRRPSGFLVDRGNGKEVSGITSASLCFCSCSGPSSVPETRSTDSQTSTTNNEISRACYLHAVQSLILTLCEQRSPWKCWLWFNVKINLLYICTEVYQSIMVQLRLTATFWRGMRWVGSRVHYRYQYLKPEKVLEGDPGVSTVGIFDQTTIVRWNS